MEPSRAPQPGPAPARDAAVAPACLNCGAALGGAWCASCGQQAVDLAAPSWVVIREAVAEATDLDGRVVRTARALLSPGRLTTEYLRGRRAPYVGPLKLFLAAGTALSTTWALTRGIDAAFYGLAPDGTAASYIAAVVRGLLAGSLAVALGTWALGRGRARLVDDAVFALHVGAALALYATLTIWLGTGLKLLWGSAARMPRGVPALFYLLFAPATLLGLGYLALALRRVHGGPWWAVVLRTLVLAGVAIAAVTLAVLAMARAG